MHQVVTAVTAMSLESNDVHNSNCTKIKLSMESHVHDQHNMITRSEKLTITFFL